EIAERERADAEALARGRAERLQKDTARAVDHLAALMSDFGRIDLKGGQRVEALRAFRKACELLEASEATKSSTPLQSALAQGSARVGTLQLDGAEREKSLDSCRKALTLLDRLPEDDRAGLGDRARLGETCYVLASVLRLLGQDEEGARAG